MGTLAATLLVPPCGPQKIVDYGATSRIIPMSTLPQKRKSARQAQERLA